MAFKWILLVTLFSLTLARPEGKESHKEHHRGSDEHHYGQSGEDSYELYYKVKDESKELDFGHQEKKSKDKVEGYFYVLLPDTRLQKVKYYVQGDSGFVADVTYEGSAEYDKGGYGHSKKHSEKKSKEQHH